MHGLALWATAVLCSASVAWAPLRVVFVQACPQAAPAPKPGPRWRSRVAASSASSVAQWPQEEVGSDLEREVGQRLAAKSAELRKAEAFRLPTLATLRREVAELEDLQRQFQPPKLQDEEEPSVVVLEASEAAAAGADAPTLSTGGEEKLADKLTLERVKAMSSEERLELIAQLGPAFGVSVAIVAICWWSVTLPVIAYAYHEATGEWPDVAQLGIEFSSDRTRGAAMGIVGVALATTALLKPLRVVAAVMLTPWTAENIVPAIPWLRGDDKGER